MRFELCAGGLFGGKMLVLRSWICFFLGFEWFLWCIVVLFSAYSFFRERERECEIWVGGC